MTASLTDPYLTYTFSHEGDLIDYARRYPQSVLYLVNRREHSINLDSTGYLQLGSLICPRCCDTNKKSCPDCSGSGRFTFAPRRLLDLGFVFKDRDALTCLPRGLHGTVDIHIRNESSLLCVSYHESYGGSRLEEYNLPVSLWRYMHDTYPYHETPPYLADLLVYQTYYDVMVNGIMHNLFNLHLGGGIVIHPRCKIRYTVPRESRVPEYIYGTLMVLQSMYKKRGRCSKTTETILDCTLNDYLTQPASMSDHITFEMTVECALALYGCMVSSATYNLYTSTIHELREALLNVHRYQ